jgi:hypothetical protein
MVTAKLEQNCLDNFTNKWHVAGGQSQKTKDKRQRSEVGRWMMESGLWFTIRRSVRDRLPVPEPITFESESARRQAAREKEMPSAKHQINPNQ